VCAHAGRRARCSLTACCLAALRWRSPDTLGSVPSTPCVDITSEAMVGFEINASHVHGVKSGWVIGAVRSLHIGRTTHMWDIRIENKEDKLVCVPRLDGGRDRKEPGVRRALGHEDRVARRALRSCWRTVFVSVQVHFILDPGTGRGRGCLACGPANEDLASFPASASAHSGA
jgi:Thioesterase superfamily